MLLRKLHDRIKGSSLWKQFGFRRLYFQTRLSNREVQVKTWFEMVGGRPEVHATVLSLTGTLSEEWCRKESIRIRKFYQDQFRDLMDERELSAGPVKVVRALKDNTPPVHAGSMAHQTAALEFLCRMKVAALFGDAGIGKTKPAIDLANSRYLHGQIRKVLVFCACSVMGDFKGQVKKWSPHSGLIWKFTGVESVGHSDVRFYEALEYADRETMIIIDESQLVKSPVALRSVRIQRVCANSSYKLLLSATPVTENPGNLFMQYAMLDHRITGHRSWTKFAGQFVLLGGTNMEEVIGYKNLDYLVSLIAPYTYQIKKEDCLVLPSKNFFSKVCDLTDRQYYYYRTKKGELLNTIARDNIHPGTIVRYLTELQQIACGFRPAYGGGYQYLGSNKFQLLERMRLDGQVIFFCKYLFEVNMLVKQLGPENCACFTSRNRGSRDLEKQLFVNGEKRYFVATPGSGGTGLDGLSVAHIMVFFSKPFRNLVSQCVGSMDRPGQTRKMSIYDLRTNTGIDRLIDHAVCRKLGMEQEISSLLRDKTKLREYAEAL